MFGDIENLKLLNIVEGISVRQALYVDRGSHGLVYKVSGESVYDFGGRTLALKEGEVLFIPKGSSYTVKRISPEESRYVLFNFEGVCKKKVPGVYGLEGFPYVGLIGTGLARMWLFGGRAEQYKCLSVFYQVLSFLTKQENTRYADTRRWDVIRPAVEHLRKHLFDCDLCAGELCRSCGMSDAYFRRIFKSRFGVTPQEYIINKRLTQAAWIISGGEYLSIQQVALSVGYRDPLYFSRAFSRRYGVSPAQYAKNMTPAQDSGI